MNSWRQIFSWEIFDKKGFITAVRERGITVTVSPPGAKTQVLTIRKKSRKRLTEEDLEFVEELLSGKPGVVLEKYGKDDRGYQCFLVRISLEREERVSFKEVRDFLKETGLWELGNGVGFGIYTYNNPSNYSIALMGAASPGSLRIAQKISDKINERFGLESYVHTSTSHRGDYYRVMIPRKLI